MTCQKGRSEEAHAGNVVGEKIRDVLLRRFDGSFGSELANVFEKYAVRVCFAVALAIIFDL